MDLFKPSTVVHAHCDLFCGVYDPAEAKIEAMSVLKAAQKYQDSDDEVFRARALSIKESQAEACKHHLSVLWTDFFGPEHVEQFPHLHDLFWRAIRAASTAKKSVDPSDGEKLVALIDEISDVFWQTEKAKGMGVYPPD